MTLLLPPAVSFGAIEVDPLVWAGMGVIAAAALAVALVTRVMSRRMSRRLGEIQAAMSAIAEGDLTKRVGEGGGEAGAFNRMADRLSELRTQIEKLNGELADATGRLRQLEGQDALTGLANHRSFHDQLEREIARTLRAERPLSLLMVDLDHFRSLNDSHGHAAGDEALTRVGKILRQNARTIDTAARTGGGEFAVLLPETDLEGAAAMGERLRVLIEAQRFAFDGKEARLTVSVGVADLATAGEPSSRAILQAVRDALGRAKEQGRNRVLRAGG